MYERARSEPQGGVLFLRIVAFAALALWFTAGPEAARAQQGPVFEVGYEARLVPSERAVHMSIALGSGARHVKWLRFRTDPTRHTGFSGDGEVVPWEDGVIWTPPPEGGRLHYIFRIDHLRDARSYDARCAKTWAIFRGDDLVPPVRARITKGARSRSRLQFVVPEGWSTVVPYTRLVGGAYRIEHAGRAFDRPTGWFALGDLGVVREEVAGTRVTIAGPVRHNLRRLDLLAALRLTLPELNRIRGEPMDRLLLVGAGDPMWRGGLSGPRSLFLHADRPLITEDATSPLLHEVVHASLSARGDDASDWIVEGLAEFYSIALLRRSDMVSPERTEKALARFRSRTQAGSGVTHGGRSTAVGLLYMIELDANIRKQTAGRFSLDDVLHALTGQRGTTDLESFTRAIASATGADPALVMPTRPGTPAS
jgi:hypothetical protein